MDGFIFFVTLLNQFYWAASATIGGISWFYFLNSTHQESVLS
ncbi:MAG: hypothetical protein ACLU00_01710 [Mediterraneibacter faecis]